MLCRVIDAITEVELSPLAGLLGSRRHVEAALALEPVEARLVHGDLAGHNMRWLETGDLVGVTHWDLAQAFDPAVDVACLAVGTVGMPCAMPSIPRLTVVRGHGPARLRWSSSCALSCTTPRLGKWRWDQTREQVDGH